MGQLLILRPRAALHPPVSRSGRRGAMSDPAAAARGILLALALSSLVWIGLALLVPRFW